MTPRSSSGRSRVAPGPAENAHPVTATNDPLGPEPRELLVSQLGLIDDLIRRAARRHRLPKADSEEFASTVRLRLIENDYAVLRKFRRQSSLRTFLTVVIARICMDYLAQQWGKWRPSAEARRLGPAALRLETLVYRDGLPFEQACTRMASEGSRATTANLSRVIDRLPRRYRRRFVDDGSLAGMVSTTPAPDAAIDRDAWERRARALAMAVAGLAPDDRRLVKLRFVNELTVAEIARQSGADQPALYRRLNRLLRCLRGDLAKYEFEGRAAALACPDVTAGRGRGAPAA